MRDEGGVWGVSFSLLFSPPFASAFVSATLVDRVGPPFTVRGGEEVGGEEEEGNTYELLTIEQGMSAPLSGGGAFDFGHAGGARGTQHRRAGGDITPRPPRAHMLA